MTGSISSGTPSSSITQCLLLQAGGGSAVPVPAAVLFLTCGTSLRRTALRAPTAAVGGPVARRGVEVDVERQAEHAAAPVVAGQGDPRAPHRGGHRLGVGVVAHVPGVVAGQ